MSKAVLLSIQPNWCKMIWAGMKEVEVRKTRPTLETPFKAYIYCTGHDGWVMKSPKAGVQKMDSRVIGEFTCDKIDKLVHVGTMMDINILTSDGWYKPADALLQAACLTEETVKKYLQGRNGYGWHISDLKIYDKPRDLDEFSRFGFWEWADQIVFAEIGVVKTMNRLITTWFHRLAKSTDVPFAARLKAGAMWRMQNVRHE